MQHRMGWKSLLRTPNAFKPMHSFRLVLADKFRQVQLRTVEFVSIFVYFWHQADIFQEYIIKEDAVGFQVNLTVLLDCLTIFGGSTVPGVYYNCDPVFFFFLKFNIICCYLIIKVCAPPWECATMDMDIHWLCSWRKVVWSPYARLTHRSPRNP